MITHNIDAFSSAFSRYVQESSKSPREALEAKGRDLGIRLYRGFSQHKWGGAGKNRRGIALAELSQRTADKKGTILRPSLMAQYLGKRQILRSESRALGNFTGPQNARTARGNARAQLRNQRARVSLWQSFVGKEVGRRQAGIGVLAASFLWYRGRSSQARGKYFVKNKTGNSLGFVDRGENTFRIVGLTKGLATIDARYGIVNTALAGAAGDMMVYIRRKQREAFTKAFASLAELKSA